MEELWNRQPRNIVQNQPKDTWWREMFIAPKGHKLIVRDFSQIELRILAVVSEDPVLLDEYMHGADVHMNNGKQIAKTLGLDPNKLTKEELKAFRNQGKSSLGFGVIYGMGSRALSEMLGVSEETADMLIMTIFNKYKGVDRWMKRVKQSGMRTGFSKTPFGRRRDIPNALSKDKGKLNYGLRQLINSAIQGGAGDFVKLAMIEVDNCLELKELGFRTLLQVHDEVIGECPAENAERCNELVSYCMSNFPAALKMPIPFPTDGGIGANWAEAKEGG